MQDFLFVCFNENFRTCSGDPKYLAVGLPVGLQWNAGFP